MARGGHDPDRKNAQGHAIAMFQDTRNSVLSALWGHFTGYRDAVNRESLQLGGDDRGDVGEGGFLVEPSAWVRSAETYRPGIMVRWRETTP